MRNIRTGKFPETLDLDKDMDVDMLFVLGKRLARQLGLSEERIAIEMSQGDFIHTVQIFDRFFGDYVDLVTEDPKLHKALLMAS